jgi:hypothetical protein
VSRLDPGRQVDANDLDEAVVLVVELDDEVTCARAQEVGDLGDPQRVDESSPCDPSQDVTCLVSRDPHA